MSVLLGTRPRASIQHSGQIDESTHSTTIARSSFVIRTLSRSPCTMRTITPQSTAAVSTAWSASLGRSSGISTPRSMPPMNGWVARNTYAAHTGRFATSTRNAPKRIANGIKSTTKPMTTAASPRANSTITRARRQRCGRRAPTDWSSVSVFMRNPRSRAPRRRAPIRNESREGARAHRGTIATRRRRSGRRTRPT